MASLTRWMWVWVNSWSWWWTGRPGVLRFMGLQKVGHDWETELHWTDDLMPYERRKLALLCFFPPFHILNNSFIHSLIIYLSSKCLLSLWCMPGILLGSRTMNKTCEVSSLLMREEAKKKQTSRHSTLDRNYYGKKWKQMKVDREYWELEWMVLFYRRAKQELHWRAMFMWYVWSKEGNFMQLQPKKQVHTFKPTVLSTKASKGFGGKKGWIWESVSLVKNDNK